MTAKRVFSAGRREARYGHRQYLDFGSRRTVDNQDEVVEAVLHERARRALYANCELAPSSWDYHVAYSSRAA
ncbi:MAG: hypothetical protein AAF707_00855 [Pseudomonadota bacterium]